MQRPILWFVALAVLATACGGGELSTTEYVEELNGLPLRYEEQFEEIWTAYVTAGEPTLDGLRTLLTADAKLRRAIQHDIDDIEPPRHFTDNHAEFSAWHASFVTANDAMAEQAEASATLEEFAASRELAAVTKVLNDGMQLCRAWEDQLSSTDAEAFEGTPWMPEDLTSAVRAAIGCDSIPEDYGAMVLGR